jgi:hypothetical protein
MFKACASLIGNPQVQSLAPRRWRHPTLSAEPDGKGDLPAINPGGFVLPGFRYFCAYPLADSLFSAAW